MLNIPMSEQQEGSLNWLLSRAAASMPAQDNYNLAAITPPTQLGPSIEAAGLSDTGTSLRRALFLNALLNRDEQGNTFNNIALAGAVTNEGIGFGNELAHLDQVASNQILNNPLQTLDAYRNYASETARQAKMALGLSALALLLRFGPKMNATEE